MSITSGFKIKIDNFLTIWIQHNPKLKELQQFGTSIQNSFNIIVSKKHFSQDATKTWNRLIITHLVNLILLKESFLLLASQLKDDLRDLASWDSAFLRLTKRCWVVSVLLRYVHDAHPKSTCRSPNSKNSEPHLRKGPPEYSYIIALG